MNAKTHYPIHGMRIVLAAFLLAAVPGISARQNEGAGQGRGGQKAASSAAVALRLEPTCSVLPPGGTCLQLDKIELLHVQGNVYMIAGAGANVAVQIGDKAVLVADTGNGQSSDKIIAAIRALTNKPILFIVSTGPDDDHTGGNAALASAGAALPNAFATDPSIIAAGVKMSTGAAIFAHFNVLGRMSEASGQKAAAPEAARPTDTYETDDWRFYNGESIYLYHAANAHTDGDSLVLFRGSDVISAGEIFNPFVSYPIPDKKRGGSIDGIVAGLNQLIELMVAKEDEEGGTYVIPGHGPISDRNDVVNYRDMVTVLRARIAMMVKKEMTLEQVKAAKPTMDYDGIGHYGASKDAFIESVYQDLKTKKK